MLVVLVVIGDRRRARRRQSRRRRRGARPSARRSASPARSSTPPRSRSGAARRWACRPTAAGYRFWRRGADDRWIALADDDVLAPRALPAGHHGRRRRRTPARRSPPTSILPFRPSGRNEPYALRRSPLPHGPLDRRRRSAEPRAGRGARGFTLVEILVALAILAVALAAGMRAVAQSADGATLLKQRTLALWVAQNRLAAAQLATPWPRARHARRRGRRRPARASSGARTSRARRIPSFRKIEIVVADPGAARLRARPARRATSGSRPRR